MASQEWHWEQGTKYAAEGIKATLLLNGAAAIALMTFATQLKSFLCCNSAHIVRRRRSALALCFFTRTWLN